MNSLTELNGYVSNLELPFTDLRSPDVLFDLVTPINQTQTADEGFTFLSKVGIEIVEVIGGSAANVYYQIDVSNLSGATVSWASLPSGVSLTTPSTGVYKLSGITAKSVWDAVKYATITTPVNYNGVFTYTSTIGYYSGADGNETKSWITTVTVNDISFLTTPADFSYAPNLTTSIQDTPQIIDVDASYPGATWTVVATPSSILSVTNFSTTGTGGTFSVNSSTKVITIVGTRTQVNSRIDGLQIVSNSVGNDFNLTYVLSNNVNSNTDTKVQALKSTELQFLGAASTPTVYFAEDADLTTITGTPIITDSAYDGTGSYVLTIVPSELAAVQTMATTGDAGTSSFNASSKTLTIAGTRSQVNARLATLTIVTGTDWSDTFSLVFSVLTPRDDTATKLQSLVCNTSDLEVSNMAMSRTYTANNQNALFATNTPQIVDLDTAASTYTIIFSSAPGVWTYLTSVDPEVETTFTSTLTYTGTRAQCNAIFSLIRFYPNANTSTNSTFTYTQQKNGTTQITQSVTLIGQAGTYTGRTVDYTSGQTWRPLVSDYLYGQFELLLVGGGGGGAYNYGGGGGGEVKSVNGLTFAYETYNINIGAGGAGSNSIISGTIAPGSNGGTTSAFGYSAAGGNGGGREFGASTGPGGYTYGGDGAGSLAGQGGNGYLNTTSGIQGGGGGGAGGTGLDSYGDADGDNASLQGSGGRGGQSAALPSWNTLGGQGQQGNGGSGGTMGNTATSGPTGAGSGATALVNATNAANNKGGGGGGGSYYFGRGGGNGGSGLVRIRIYAK
jgi:hypothetical protein